MRVALFGGRFDPIHNGHIAVAKEILTLKKADQVWFVPDNQHQWNPTVASTKDRLKMTELAIDEVFKHNESVLAFAKASVPIRVDDTAIRLGGMTETLTIVREIRKQHPDNTYFFVGGSDQLATLHKWTHWKELQKELQFLIIIRKGYPVTHVPSNCLIIADPMYIPLEDSATRVRERLKKGESISDLVPKKVEEYIKKRGLYVRN